MGVRILESTEGEAVLYCSTSDWAFGPVFPDAEQAEAFLEFIDKDPRSMTDKELSFFAGEFFAKWIEIKAKRDAEEMGEGEDDDGR